MRPNLGRVGRDPGQLGQCSNSHRLLLMKASLRFALLVRYNPKVSLTKYSYLVAWGILIPCIISQVLILFQTDRIVFKNYINYLYSILYLQAIS